MDELLKGAHTRLIQTSSPISDMPAISAGPSRPGSLASARTEPGEKAKTDKTDKEHKVSERRKRLEALRTDVVDTSDFLPIGDVATILGVSPKSVQRYTNPTDPAYDANLAKCLFRTKGKHRRFRTIPFLRYVSVEMNEPGLADKVAEALGVDFSG